MAFYTCKEETDILNRCDVCGKTYPSFKKLQQHRYCHSQAKNALCEVCGKKFLCKSLMDIHKKYVHASPSEKKECEFCGKTYKGGPSLRQHIISVHERKYAVTCNKCGKGYFYKKLLDEHYKVVHEKSALSCQYCKKPFKTARGLKCHVAVHDPNLKKPEYTCKICGEMFTSKSSGLHHRKKHETKRGCIMCDVCGKSLTTTSGLTKHMRTHTGEKPFVCNTCGKTFAKGQQLTTHIRVHTDEKPYRCDICKKGFRQIPALKVHMRYHTGDKPYACKVCPGRYVTSTLLKNHRCAGPEKTLVRARKMCKEETDTLNRCDVCGKTYPSFKKLQQHEYYHSQAKTVSCELCGKKFLCKSLVDLHKQYVHTSPSEKKECEFCGKICKSELSLRRHIIHVHERKYAVTCNKCGKGYFYKKLLEEHYKVVHEESTLSCQYCKKPYKTSRGLKRHVAVHDPNLKKPEYTCKICGETFTSKSSGLHHRKKHETKRGCIMCDVCGKSLTTASGLTKHMRTHTGEKPFVCNTCGKTFAKGQQLTTHVRVHTDEKPYRCDICKKGFRQIPALKIHMKYHADDKPYACKVCPKRYVTSTLLKSHRCTGPY